MHRPKADARQEDDHLQSGRDAAAHSRRGSSARTGWRRAGRSPSRSPSRRPAAEDRTILTRSSLPRDRPFVQPTRRSGRTAARICPAGRAIAIGPSTCSSRIIPGWWRSMVNRRPAAGSGTGGKAARAARRKAPASAADDQRVRANSAACANHTTDDNAQVGDEALERGRAPNRWYALSNAPMTPAMLRRAIVGIQPAGSCRRRPPRRSVATKRADVRERTRARAHAPTAAQTPSTRSPARRSPSRPDSRPTSSRSVLT